MIINCQCGRRWNIADETKKLKCACGAIHELQSNQSYKIIEVDESMKPSRKLAPAMVAKYHELWDRLHREVRTSEQYTDWLRDLSDARWCPCRDHWAKIATDPNPSDPWWSIDLHNKVNERLGKPHFSDEEAIQKYAISPRE